MKYASTLIAFSLFAILTLPASAQHPVFGVSDFASYSPNVENGEHLFNAGGCAACHSVDGDDTILAGGRVLSTKLGELYAPNITEHAEAGVGGWSNPEYLNAVLNGVSPDGRSYFGAVFPYGSFARMSPEDVLDIRGYIATLPRSEQPSKPHNLSFVSKSILRIWAPDRGALSDQTDPQMQRGQYLAESVGHCAECHTPRDTGFGFSYDLSTDAPYAGEVGIFGDYAPDLTATRLGRLGAQAFVVGALAEGKKLNGSPMTSASMRRIARATAKLPLEDRAALFAYLSNSAVDVATLTDAKPTQTTTASPANNAAQPNVMAKVIVDTTGATALMARANAYCEAQDAPAISETTDPAGGANSALEAKADKLIETYCRACHAPGKTYGAVFPTGDISDMPFDAKIMVPGDPEGSLLYESIASNRMPIGQKMNADELGVLHAWISATVAPDTPLASEPAVTEAIAQGAAPVDLPKFALITRQEMVLAMANDINAVAQQDRRFMRYFSFGQTPLSEVDCSQTDARRNPMHYLHSALNKLVNSLSLAPKTAQVSPVKGTDGGLVRVDMRDYGWTDEQWKTLTTGAYTPVAQSTGFDRLAWDKLAQVYPYAVDPSSDPLLAAVADATGTAIPMMRADWMTHFATKAPYYDMFLGLTADIRDLERRIGLDVDHEIQMQNVARSAMLPGSSGVSDHNRMLERFDLPRNGYYWKSYDFAGDSGAQSLALHPDGPAELSHTASGTQPFEHDGGEMILSLPNGLQAYYLSTNLGVRLTVGPASIVSYRTKPIGKGVEIENARSCFDCHADGIIAKQDEMRARLDNSASFSRDQLQVLQTLYPGQEVMDLHYKTDSKSFLQALSTLNATEQTADGRLTSLAAPMSAGGGEILTYLADMHFNSLTLDQVAREFHMDVEQFQNRLRTLGDPVLTTVTNDWMARLTAGGKLHRSELEAHYGDVMGRISDLRSYRQQGGYVTAQHTTDSDQYQEDVVAAIADLSQQAQGQYIPAITKPLADPVSVTPAADRLQLALTVPNLHPRVNDLLEFEISANRRCELQIFYIEESKNVEELPASLLGPNYLDAGEYRRIPYAGSGLQIRFDTAGTGETMLAFCREGGLGQQRMTASQVLDFAKRLSVPLTRGITIEAADRVTKDAGQSASNHVTFDVKH